MRHRIHEFLISHLHVVRGFTSAGALQSIEMLRSILSKDWLERDTRAQLLCNKATSLAMIGRYEEAQASLEEARALSPRGQGIRCSIEMTSSKVKEHQADAMATENPIITPTAAALELYAEAKAHVEVANAILQVGENHAAYARIQVKMHPDMMFLVEDPAEYGLNGGRGLTVEETTPHPVFEELPPGPPLAAGENPWYGL